MSAFLCWLAVRVLEMHRILKPTGSLYLHIDHTAHAYAKTMLDAIFGRSNFRNEIVWCYFGPSNVRRNFPRKHDTILFYSKEDRHTFNREAVRVPYKILVGTPGGIIGDQHSQKRVNELREKGKVVEDYWTDIFPVVNQREKVGYPTQKPLALYERIIKASSNEGDIVLDPFAGCATTCVAAERLGRKWVAVDVNKEAVSIIRDRLKREVNENMNWNDDVQTSSEPPARTDDKAFAAPELTLVSPKPKAPRLTARQLRDRLIMAEEMKCQGCGWVPHHEEYLEVDHRVPKSLGGRDGVQNRVLLCSPCNGAKTNKLTLAELRLRRIEEGRMVDKSWDAAWYQRTGRFG